MKRDPTYMIIECINYQSLGFEIKCDYIDKDLRVIKKGSLSIELYPHLNPYITYDTAIRMVTDYYYKATSVPMFDGIRIYPYTEFELAEGDYGFDNKVLFDFITGVYFSSFDYKNYSSISKYASELLFFTVVYCKFEYTNFIKEDLPVKDLLKRARNLIAKVIKKRHNANITGDIMYTVKEKHKAASCIINAMLKSRCFINKTTDVLDKDETTLYIDSMDLLYKEYNLPEGYKFSSVYDKSINTEDDSFRLFFTLSENNEKIFKYIEKSKLDL